MTNKQQDMPTVAEPSKEDLLPGSAWNITLPIPGHEPPYDKEEPHEIGPDDWVGFAPDPEVEYDDEVNPPLYKFLGMDKPQPLNETGALRVIRAGDVTPVLTQAGFSEALGRSATPSTSGADQFADTPTFLRSERLKPFIDNTLTKSPTGGDSHDE